MTDTNRLEYETRVDRVVDHLHEHLAEELSLVALARVAAFLAVPLPPPVQDGHR